MLGPRRGSVKDLGSGLSPPPRRGYSPLGASRELGGEVSSRVRALRAGDEAAVLALWSGNVTEHLEVLSYDRWGPGVPVPARPEVDEVAAVTVDPYDGVKRLIGRYLTDPALFCLVAQDGGPDLDGFLTGAVTPSVLDDSSRGVIGELYVRPQRRRRGLAGELVDAAVREFRRRDATMSKVEMPADWAGGIAFWRSRRHWEQDSVVFSRYE